MLVQILSCYVLVLNCHLAKIYNYTHKLTYKLCFSIGVEKTNITPAATFKFLCLISVVVNHFSSQVLDFTHVCLGDNMA